MSGRPLNEEEVRSWLKTDYPQKGGGIDVPKAAEDGIQRLKKGESLIQVEEEEESSEGDDRWINSSLAMPCRSSARL